MVQPKVPQHTVEEPLNTKAATADALTEQIKTALQTLQVRHMLFALTFLDRGS